MFDADPSFRPCGARAGSPDGGNDRCGGRPAEAADLYASLCARASSVGLLPEQIDPSSGKFFGNFPRAFSHIGVIAAGVTLARAFEDERAAPTGPMVS